MDSRRCTDYQAIGRQHLGLQRSRKGTTFKIYFPRVSEPRRRTSARPNIQQISQGTETILLAEDEDAVRLFSRTVLEKYGYEVLEAKRWQKAALLICERHKSIHLLITDLIMPEMSGRELAERLVAAPSRDESALHVRLYRQRDGASRGAGRQRAFPAKAVHDGEARLNRTRDIGPIAISAFIERRCY